MEPSNTEKLQHVPFPVKLHQLLDEMEETGQTNVISWRTNGKNGFKIHDRKKFAEEIMPKFFGSNKLKSFQRSLNLWGFSSGKRIDERGIYCHKDFHRLKPEFCYDMKRVKVKRNNTGTNAGADPEDDTVGPEVPQEKKTKNNKKASSSLVRKRLEEKDEDAEVVSRSNCSTCSKATSSSSSSSNSSTKKKKRNIKNQTNQDVNDGKQKKRKTSSSPQKLDAKTPAIDNNSNMTSYGPSSSAAIIQELRRAQQQNQRGNNAATEALDLQSQYSPFTTPSGLGATHPQLGSTLSTATVTPSLGSPSPFASLLAPVSTAVPPAAAASSSASVDSTINDAAVALNAYILRQQLQQQQQQQVLPAESSSALLQVLLVQQAQQAAASAGAATASARSKPAPSPAPSPVSQVDIIINALLMEQYAPSVAAAAAAADKEQEQKRVLDLVRLLQLCASSSCSSSTTLS